MFVSGIQTVVSRILVIIAPYVKHTMLLKKNIEPTHPHTQNKLFFFLSKISRRNFVRRVSNTWCWKKYRTHTHRKQTFFFLSKISQRTILRRVSNVVEKNIEHTLTKQFFFLSLLPWKSTKEQYCAVCQTHDVGVQFLADSSRFII